MILEHKFFGGAAKGDVPESDYTVPIGKAHIARSGKDVTLCGIGRTTHVCLDAAQTLHDEFGIAAEVIDVLTLAPLDEETILESVVRTHRLVVVDEDNPVCSMARDIAARAADRTNVGGNAAHLTRGLAGRRRRGRCGARAAAAACVAARTSLGSRGGVSAIRVARARRVLGRATAYETEQGRAVELGETVDR